MPNNTALVPQGRPLAQQQMPIRVAAPPAPANAEKKRQIILLARELGEIGWGNQGSIVGMHEMVDITKIWPNPWHPIEHAPKEVQGMADSLLTAGQLEDVAVCYARDPRSLEDGGTGGTLLIADGDLRYRGALYAGLDKLRVTVKPFTSLTQLMLDYATRTLHRHKLSALEIGRTILRIRKAYETETRNQQQIPAFPTQEELGRMLGRSQPVISQWLKLANQSFEFVDLVDSEQISCSQALELVRIADETERLRQAYALAERNPQQQISSLELRRELAAQRQLFPDGLTASHTDLWTIRMDDQTPTAMVMGYAAHDLFMLLTQHLEQSKEQKTATHPALSRLHRALGDPAIQEFVKTLAATI